MIFKLKEGSFIYYNFIRLSYTIKFSYLMRKIDHNELKRINGLDRVSTQRSIFRIKFHRNNYLF